MSSVHCMETSYWENYDNKLAYFYHECELWERNLASSVVTKCFNQVKKFEIYYEQLSTLLCLTWIQLYYAYCKNICSCEIFGSRSCIVEVAVAGSGWCDTFERWCWVTWRNAFKVSHHLATWLLAPSLVAVASKKNIESNLVTGTQNYIQIFLCLKIF